MRLPTPRPPRLRSSSSTSVGVGYINSTGIALIVRFLADGRRDRRELRACGLSPHYAEIFELTRLSDYMRIFDDPASATAVATGEIDRRQDMTSGTTTHRGASALADGQHDRDPGRHHVGAPRRPSWTPTPPRRPATSRTIVLDFSGLDYMNSGGIGLLVTLLVRVQRQGQRLLAFGLSEHYRQILDADPSRRGDRDLRHGGGSPGPGRVA